MVKEDLNDLDVEIVRRVRTRKRLSASSSFNENPSSKSRRQQPYCNETENDHAKEADTAIANDTAPWFCNSFNSRQNKLKSTCKKDTLCSPKTALGAIRPKSISGETSDEVILVSPKQSQVCVRSQIFPGRRKSRGNASNNKVSVPSNVELGHEDASSLVAGKKSENQRTSTPRSAKKGRKPSVDLFSDPEFGTKDCFDTSNDILGSMDMDGIDGHIETNHKQEYKTTCNREQNKLVDLRDGEVSEDVVKNGSESNNVKKVRNNVFTQGNKLSKDKLSSDRAPNNELSSDRAPNNVIHDSYNDLLEADIFSDSFEEQALKLTSNRNIAKKANISKENNAKRLTTDKTVRDVSNSGDIVSVDNNHIVLSPKAFYKDKGNVFSPIRNRKAHYGTVVTPASAGSLKDRIKKRLHENAKSSRPLSDLCLQRRDEMVQKAQEEAVELQKQGMEFDIGPFYGLPIKVQKLYEDLQGIKTLYEWQNECLTLPAVLESRNLIYSLPTSGGKTLVAEILIMRELLCKKRDAMLVLPYVSIVQEKVRNISQFAVNLDFLVEEYAGSKGKYPPTKRRTNHVLYIATIEKSHSLVNSLIEEDRLDSLGLVIVDELHMIGEGGSRGATLEAALLKILYCGTKIQIVGMSATLNNIKDLQTFLRAEVYTNDFRPVKLSEYIKVEDTIYQVNNSTLCPDEMLIHDRVVTFKYPDAMRRTDPDHLFGLVLEVIPKHSCLVFCHTKKNCENVATMLSKMMNKYNRNLTGVKRKERKALLRELMNDGNGEICPVLQYTVHYGIAYHHSGLTMDERRLIEDAYSDGTLCLLTCTSTLAAGVNLPAKKVILRSPFVGSQYLSRSQYKQMVGRAGRAGIDSSGESILITKPSDRRKVMELVSGPLDSCHSSLIYDGGKGIRTLLLSCIGLKITITTTAVFRMMEKTLLAVQTEKLQCDIATVTREALQNLLDSNLVVQKRTSVNDTEELDEMTLDVTELGRATFKGSVDLEYSSLLYNDLQTGKESLVVVSHLHLLYLVTPYNMKTTTKPNWLIYFEQMSLLTPAEMKVAELVGVPESYIARKASGHYSKQKVNDIAVQRFYYTLMLYDLWKQKTIWEVSARYQQPRGFIQNLLNSAASFAMCVFHFCKELEEFWAYQDLFGNFVKRLSYCVTMELIPLMEIPGVKMHRARQLFAAGYKTLTMVSHADPEGLVKSLEHMPRKMARQIVASAKMLLNEKADSLREEVEELVKVPSVVPMATSALPSNSQDSVTTINLTLSQKSEILSVMDEDFTS